MPYGDVDHKCHPPMTSQQAMPSLCRRIPLDFTAGDPALATPFDPVKAVLLAACLLTAVAFWFLATGGWPQAAAGCFLCRWPAAGRWLLANCCHMIAVCWPWRQREREGNHSGGMPTLLCHTSLPARLKVPILGPVCTSLHSAWRRKSMLPRQQRRRQRPAHQIQARAASR